MTDRPVAAVILAAGKGTRMKSARPKILHPLLGLPLSAHPLFRVLELAASPVVLVLGYGAGKAKAVFSKLVNPARSDPPALMGGSSPGGHNVAFAIQKEQLGTGHATLQVKPALENFAGDVLILPGDAPLVRATTLRQLLEYHRAQKAKLTILSTELPEPAHYGRMVRGADGSLEAIVEAKDASPEVLAIREINSGIYLVDADFLFDALARVGNRNAQKEYYLTDIVAIARADGLACHAMCHPDSEELAGVNNRVELARAEAWMRREVNRHWQLEGITFEDPESTRVELGCRMEPDIYLAAGVQLLGNCRIASGCHIGPGAILKNMALGPDCSVGAYAVLDGGELPPESTVPPLVHRNFAEA